MSEHIHNVYDTDLRFTIDPVTRAITNTSGKSVLIQGDHGSERATFELPKVIEGHDMTQCNKVRVQYINTGAKPGEVSADAYDVTDLAATSATSDKLTCSWLIEHPATKYAGKLAFLLEFLCLDGTAITYAWHTDKCTDLTVKSGINAMEAIAEEYPDIIAKWEARVTEVEAAVGLIVESDGLGTIKIAKAKTSDEPDEPDEPVEPEEPELDPHTLSGAVVTVDDAAAVGLPLEISAGADATKLFVGGKNWWPDGDLEFTGNKNNQPLPMMYPAGEYRCKADVTLSEGATDTFCLLQLKNLDTAKTTSARLRIDGKEWVANVSHPFTHYSIFAAEGANVPNTAQIKNIVLQYGGGCEWEQYSGVAHDLPVSGLTVQDTPLYVFTDGSEDVQVTYYTPAEPEEPDTPIEPEEPVDPEYTYVGEAKVLLFAGEMYDSFRDRKSQKAVDELGKRVDALQTLVEQGGGTGGGGMIEAPPTYYFTNDYLPNKVSTINTRMQNTAANGDAFIFITDQHTEQGKNAGQTPSLLRYISNNTKVRRLFSGGDVGLTQAQQVAYHEQMEQAFDGDVHYVMGNHEYDRQRATDADLYYIHDINKPNQIGNSARHYYYVDNPQQKLRYVVVNNWMSMGATADGGKADDLEAQAAWLTDTAFRVEAGWGIVVFCHQFFNDPGASAPSGTATAFMEAIDGYDGDGEILAVFHGHIHADMVNHTTSGVPVIGVTADKTDISMETKPICTQVNRTAGTITEQAFDVVIVDRTARKLHCVRIGAPAVGGDGAVGNEQVEIRVVDFRATT